MARASWLVVGVALAATGCGHTEPLRVERVRLNGNVWPQRVAVAQDESVWFTDEYDGVGHYAHGHTRTFRSVLGDTAADVTIGPDGAVWFAGFDSSGRVDATGTVRRWMFEASAVAATDDAVWLAPTFTPGAFTRITRVGARRRYRISRPRSGEVSAVTAGAEGSVWFTLDRYRDGPGLIGRIDPRGTIRTWPLPIDAGPTSLTVGPDGALWVTLARRGAIVRVTTTGHVTEHALAGLAPTAIAAGKDRALWFTAASCIGRITTRGEIATWPLPDARTLAGIARAPDGTLWAADTAARSLFHITLPRGNVESRRRCGPPALVRRAAHTRARLTYRRLDTLSDVGDFFTDPQIAISRNGNVRFREQLPGAPTGDGPSSVFGYAHEFWVRDLDGDGEPEADVRLNWNGTHCCSWERVYRWDARRRTYAALTQFWGNGEPSTRDLDGDGIPEFRYDDDRFAYDFCGYAGSARPIQIWSYRRGRFVNVTRRFPRLVRAEAATLWRDIVRESAHKDSCIQGLVPAWAADEYMLGNGARVWPRVARLRIHRAFGAPGGAAYVRALRRLLERTGYMRRE